MQTSSTDWLAVTRRAVPPADLSASATRTLHEGWPDAFALLDDTSFMRLYGVDSGFFYLPMCLWNYLIKPTPTDPFLFRLGTSIAIGHAHFAIMDRVIDERSVNPPLIPAAQIMLSTYLDRMDADFGDVIDVRRSHDHFYEQYAVAAIREHRDRFKLRPVVGSDISFLGMKSAPACMPLLAILKLAGHDDETANIAVSVFLDFAGSLQLLDDLSDIESDYRDGLSSVPLNLLFDTALGLTEWPDSTAMSAELFPLSVITKVREACLGMAHEELARVCETSKNIGLAPLYQAAVSRKKEVEGMLEKCRESAPVV